MRGKAIRMLAISGLALAVVLGVAVGAAVANKGPVAYRGPVKPDGGIKFDVAHPDSNIRPSIENLNFGEIGMNCTTPKGTHFAQIGGEDSSTIHIDAGGGFSDGFDFEGATFKVRGDAVMDRQGVNTDKPIKGQIKVVKIEHVNCSSPYWDFKAKPQS